MTSLVTKENLEKLLDNRLNLLCWFFGVPCTHQSAGKDSKLARLWTELVRRDYGDESTVLVHVSKAVWQVVTEAPHRAKRQDHVDKLRALEAQ